MDKKIYNSETHILLSRINDNGDIVSEIIEKSVEDIRVDKLFEVENFRLIALNKLWQQIVEEQIQSYDDKKAITIKEAYPIWKSGLVVKVDDKYQDFDFEGNITLWKVVEEHVTDDTCRPKDSKFFIKLI